MTTAPTKKTNELRTTKYSTITIRDDDDDEHKESTESYKNHENTTTTCNHAKNCLSIPLSLLGLIVVAAASVLFMTMNLGGGGGSNNPTRLPYSASSSSQSKTATTTPVILATAAATTTTTATKLPMPYGVNLASWLSLEDYFFVGDNGATEVATTNGSVAAHCLPPLLPTGMSWNSETDLFASLMQQYSVKHAIRVFQAFRVSYMDFDADLSQMAAHGIQNVRVPVSWCLTDHDPSTDPDLVVSSSNSTTDKDTDKTLLQRYTCKDPFYDQQNTDVYWPAVPKALLVQFLRACRKYGIRATLDIHTYMGGTSLGTFSGVWPRQPLFWQYDDPERKQDDVGRLKFQEWLTWIESLSDTCPEAFAGIGGITPMNEPAHLAGLFGHGSSNPHDDGFLPPLPNHLAHTFLKDLNRDTSSVNVPDGTHLRVLMWQSDAVAMFRQTSLPSKGVSVVVNVHESIFAPSLVANDASDDGATHPHAAGIFATWWESITTPYERGNWAVLDMHHYHAWEPVCSGTNNGEGSYTCGDVDATVSVLNRCTSWANVYRSALTTQEGFSPPVLYSGEFSASTFHSVLHSCMDSTTLRKSYLTQVEAAHAANVKLFWWSWKMPFGGAFRPAWSFRHLMYLLGEAGFTRPDESTLPCN